MDLAHEPPFRLGGLSVRPSTREIEHAGGRETLEPRVMEVLVVLAKAQGEVVSRDDLIAACWDGRIVSEDAINRVVSRIRRLAASTGERDFKLETITKVGYRLVAASAADNAATGPSADLAAPQAPARAEPRRGIASLAAAALAAVVVLILVAVRFMPDGPALVGVRTDRQLVIDVRSPPDGPEPASDRALTLAVLPFDTLSTTPETGFVAEGLSRELRNSLSRVRGLRVIADSSSFAVAAQPLGAVEIGDQLGADLLLDGSVRDAEGMLRVTMELVDAETGAQTWTAARSLSADDLARGEETLLVAVLEELVARLGPERIEAFAPARTPDPESFRLTLQAEEIADQAATLRQQGRFEDFSARADEARAIAERAVEIDPNNADALVLLARLSTRLSNPSLPSDSVLGSQGGDQMELFNRALAADPDNPAALTALGERLRSMDWRWREGEALLDRALAIDPNFADAHTAKAYLMSHMGRCIEGLEHARAAARLDPAFIWRRFAEPRLLKCIGRRDEASKLYLELLDSDREQVFLATEITLNHMTDRNAAVLRAAAAHIRDELWAGEEMPEPMARQVARMEAGADALEGRPDAYRALLDHDAAVLATYEGRPRMMTETGRSSSDVMWTLAVEYAAIGEADKAIDLLEEAVAGGSLYIPETMPYGAYEFTLEIRANPRYQALWNSDRRLAELVEIRRQSVEDHQMEGVLPNGRRMRPAG